MLLVSFLLYCAGTCTPALLVRVHSHIRPCRGRVLVALLWLRFHVRRRWRCSGSVPPFQTDSGGSGVCRRVDVAAERLPATGQRCPERRHRNDGVPRTSCVDHMRCLTLLSSSPRLPFCRRASICLTGTVELLASRTLAQSGVSPQSWPRYAAVRFCCARVMHL